MKHLLILVLSFIFAITVAHAQQGKPRISPARKGYLLDSIFPIDNIIGITVSNNSGTHVLTAKELTYLKGQLKQARYAGGVIAKPGHIRLSLKLKNSSEETGAYAYTGSIHFRGATSRFNKYFSGSYYLPTQLNFDNYR